MLFRVVAPHYCCGVIADHDTRRILAAAPIIGWCVGKSIDYFQQWCRKKGYRCEFLADH